MSTALTLTRLERILDAHRRVQQSAGDMLRWALVAGHELTEQKQRLAHGEWLPWLSQNVPFSERTAQVYMRLDEGREQIAQANAQSAADLSVAGALKLIQKPKETKPASQTEVLNVLRQGREPQRTTVEINYMTGEFHEVRDWTDQQTSRFTRALDKLTQATQQTEDARGLAGYGASEQLKDAAISARQAAAILDDLAGSF